MFKLKNTYSIKKLMQKIELNANIMFSVYIVLVLLALSSFYYNYILHADSLIAYIFIIIGGFSFFILFFLLHDYIKNKKNKYSVFLLSKQPFFSFNELDYKIRNSESLGDRLSISNEYFFCLKSSFYIPFVIPVITISKAYIKIGRGYKVNLYLVTDKNMTYKMPIGLKFMDSRDFNTFAQQIFLPISMHAPHITLGFLELGFFSNKFKSFDCKKYFKAETT